ncbi:cardiolipin synthase [Niallia sp. 03133]|uniref:cardiolipin synthase n=1 Tax=Niallia sp. 03133 TaxID=3458060 RepID=UPI0040441E7E
MKSLLFIIFILLILILLLSIDFHLGRKHHLKKISRHNHAFRYSDFHLYRDGTELFPDLFSSIKNAKNHIHILFYTVKADSISNEFLSLLKDKANEGVEVRLILDWLGSFKLKKKAVNKLKSAGVQFRYCQIPKLPFLFFSLQVRNHRKITIIDGNIGFMGGFNIGKDYIHANLKLSPWRDYHMKIEGEGIEDLQRAFLIDWLEASKINLLQNDVYFPKQKKGHSRHQTIPSKGKYLEEELAHIIRNSNSSLIIGTPYFIPSKQLTQELILALKRNVSVTFLLPNNADHLLVKEASFPPLRILLSKGAQVFQYTHGFFHGKVLVADDEICLIGSSNFDKRSIFLNHEINCSIYDPVFIRHMKEVIADDLQTSNEIFYEDIASPSPWQFIKERTALILSPFL